MKTKPRNSIPASTRRKMERMAGRLSKLDGALLAYSGGVDSTFLMHAAQAALGRKLLAVTVQTPLTPAEEIHRARQLAKQLGVRHRVLRLPAQALPILTLNPPDRCYHCKKAIFGRLLDAARKSMLPVVMDATNRDDLDDYRPGLRALGELGVASPLRDAGLTKQEIRALSHAAGLPTWNQLSAPCLATRVPYGTAITPVLIQRIAKAEALVRRRVSGPIRVRAHGPTARIEVEPQAWPGLLRAAPALVKSFRRLGFLYTALDLSGYRTGALNEGLSWKKKKSPRS